MKDLYSDSDFHPSEKIIEEKIVFQNNARHQEKRESFDGQTNETSLLGTDNCSSN